MEEIRIRPATVEDLPHVLRHRRAMFEDMGARDPARLDRMMAAAEPYFRDALAKDTFRAWLAEDAGGVVGGGGVSIIPWPPSPDAPYPHRAYVHNVYTEPHCRRRGVARKLMDAMVEWCRSQSYRYVTLHASDHGRPLYDRMGFQPTNELRLYIS
jgi:GNAT superfamily N-acetyltransferase